MIVFPVLIRSETGRCYTSSNTVLIFHRLSGGLPLLVCVSIFSIYVYT